jgi:hypothetical protein
VAELAGKHLNTVPQAGKDAIAYQFHQRRSGATSLQPTIQEGLHKRICYEYLFSPLRYGKGTPQKSVPKVLLSQIFPNVRMLQDEGTSRFLSDSARRFAVALLGS